MWFWQNSYWGKKLNKSKIHLWKTPKIRLWQESIAQIMIKPKNQLGMKLKRRQESKTWILTKLRYTQLKLRLKNLNCDRTWTQIVTKLKLRLWQNLNSKLKTSISDIYQNIILLRTTWHLYDWWHILRAAFCNLVMFFGQRKLVTVPS